MSSPPTRGRWTSTTVPLADAWASGARAWTEARRGAYANDLGYRPSLRAVTLSTNRSKGDSDPADWLPPRRGDWCSYVADWVAVKWRRGLATDAGERAAVLRVMNGCPADALVVLRPGRP